MFLLILVVYFVCSMCRGVQVAALHVRILRVEYCLPTRTYVSPSFLVDHLDPARFQSHVNTFILDQVLGQSEHFHFQSPRGVVVLVLVVLQVAASRRDKFFTRVPHRPRQLRVNNSRGHQKTRLFGDAK